MTDTGKIREEMSLFLKEKGYNLYSLDYTSEKDGYVLHIELDNHLDLNGVADASKEISDFLDEKDYFQDAYMLDVSTVGLERVLNGYDEILKAKGEYVFVKMRKETDGLKKVEGTLEDVSEDEIQITYRSKNISKKMLIKISDIKLIRLAVKF